MHYKKQILTFLLISCYTIIIRTGKRGADMNIDKKKVDERILKI